MRKKTIDELRSKSAAEIRGEIAKAEKELIEHKMNLKIGKIKNTSLARIKSDWLAVAKTLVKEKEFAK